MEKGRSLPVVDFNYEILTEYDNVYFWSVEETGKILYMNECMRAAFGYSKRDLSGISAFDLAPEYNSDGDYQWNRIDEVLKNPTNPPVRNFELRCKNGDTLWLELRTKVFVSPETNKRYSICVGIDISSRRKMGQDLKKIHSHLLLSVFFNNALEKDFSFTELSHYAAALGTEIFAPVVCLLLQPRYGFSFRINEPLTHAEWNLWAINGMQSALSGCKAVVWDSREGIAALVSLSPDQAFEQQITTLIDKIAGEAQKPECPIQPVLGLSDVWLKPENISIPYKQARESAGFGALNHPDDFAHRWKKLGVIKLLLDMNQSRAEQFIEEQLGPLMRLPHVNKTALLQTLCEILTTHSVSLMAKRLHVHPKTITYRRERLEKLLGADFDDPLTRTDLFVALRLYQIHNPR